MLDLNYVRENLDRVRAALEERGLAPAVLDDFVRADAERRGVIAESDALNAQRNSASREIGTLMKEGKRDEATLRRNEVSELKERIAESTSCAIRRKHVCAKCSRRYRIF